MNNITHTFRVSDVKLIKQKVLSWLQQFGTFCFLDSNQYAPNEYDFLAGAGMVRSLETSAAAALQQLQLFINEKKSWLFGHIGYELAMQDVERKSKTDHLQFPDIYFFEPEIIIQLQKNGLQITAAHPQKIFHEINTQPAYSPSLQPPVAIQSRMSRAEYINVVHLLQQHIRRGDCYEINFCQEFFAENVTLNLLDVFTKLNDISPNPFAALYRFNNKWLACASPERFLKKTGSRILSQPIKGTLRRAKFDAEGLKKEQHQLLHSQKDRAENVMIVDLVRNDLSRICTEGSVQVDELFGIYSFPQVHQMISTISGELDDNIDFKDIIQATFPMGSMTGAPKLRVMQLIEQYEKNRRGIFSGALGYINANGDFDFNVVIRSLMYNAATRYLSFQAGSGITTYSDAQKEWEECIVKTQAITRALNSGGISF